MENFIMSRRPSLSFPVIIALAAMSLPALAKSNSKATIKTTVDLTSTTKVGSTTLAPGHYEVVVEGNQAKFERDGKTVAEVHCTLKDLSTKAQQTEATADHDQLTEIQVSGKTQAIEFSAN
jgi:secreted trypsin-like serine protease